MRSSDYDRRDAGDAGDADDDREASRSQQEWQAIAGAVRNSLMTAVGRLPNATPAEAKALLEACRDAYWLEINARSFDTNVAHENSKSQHSWE